MDICPCHMSGKLRTNIRTHRLGSNKPSHLNWIEDDSMNEYNMDVKTDALVGEMLLEISFCFG